MDQLSSSDRQFGLSSWVIATCVGQVTRESAEDLGKSEGMSHKPLLDGDLTIMVSYIVRVGQIEAYTECHPTSIQSSFVSVYASMNNDGA